MNYNFSAILADIDTKLERDALMLELENLLDSFFVSKRNTFEKLDEIVSFDRREKILESCKLNSIDVSDMASFKDFCTQLLTKIKELSVIELTLAFSPPRLMLDRVSQWFDHVLSKKIILEIKVKPEILGGVRVSYHGLYRDYSVKKLLEEKIKAGKVSFI